MKFFIRYFFVSCVFLSCQKTTEPIGLSEWRLQYDNNDDITYYAIQFTDENNGWIIGYSGTIKKTSDGGKTWISQPSETTANLWDISFIDNETGWICGAENTVLKTANSGQTWTKISLAGISETINVSIQFIDENNGWLSNNQGEILKSNDGGINWVVVKHNNIGGANLAVFDENTTYFFSGKLFRTFDGGVKWDSTNVSLPKNYRISDISFPNQENGYFSTENGTGGTIIKEYPVVSTKNGGISYQSSDYLSSYGFRCIYFEDEDYGWIAGDNIYRTINGGETWQLNYHLDSGTLHAKDIYFINRNCGWLITWDGQIYKYESN